MGNGSGEFTQMELRRAPGRRGGCSCCGFTMAGIMGLPLVALALLILAI